MKEIVTLLTFFLGTALLFSQQTTAQKELLKKANENFELSRTNPEKAFLEAKKIEKEAQKTNAKEAELKSLRIQYHYYNITNAFENKTKIAELLFEKAKLYKSALYQAQAKVYIADVYLDNDLPQKALVHLKEGMEILNNTDGKNPAVNMIRSDLYIAFSKYSFITGECDDIIKYVKKSINEKSKILNDSIRQGFQYTSYANLASAYMSIDYDSAKYYAEHSLFTDDEDVKFLSLSILGRIAGNEGNNDKALSYLLKAEKLKGFKNHINNRKLYDDIIGVYNSLNDFENVKKYQLKRDSLELSISKKQNDYLHNLLGKEKEGNTKPFVYALIVLSIFLLVLVIFIIRKNRILSRQEKVSQKYLEEISKTPDGEDYSRIINALKENDLAFMNYFEEYFPEFSSKLIAINPKISSSEIEFCALLKLKIPTKEIARYKFRAPQTVRNKKYIIRNKLHIPKDVDIYEWFDGL